MMTVNMSHQTLMMNMKIDHALHKLPKIMLLMVKTKDKKSKQTKIVSINFFCVNFGFVIENIEKTGFISNLFNKVKSGFSDAFTSGFTSSLAERDQPLTLKAMKSSSFEERATFAPVMNRSLE